MLAFFKQEPLKKVVDALRVTPEDPEFWIEEKLDGERMQMHMVADEDERGGKRFKFWSRKAKDYTLLYGKGFYDTAGSLTQFIRNCFVDGVESIILDGEMITWDPVEKATVPFGSLKTAALAEQRNPFSQGHRPVFRIFDILLLNDQPLTRYELRDRRRALAASIKSEPERFEIHPYTVATKVEEVEDLLRQVVADASEGLVLKNPRSMYILDDRSGDWQKVKPEYMSGYGEELDCVILGGYYGSGKRGGFLSSFLCGLRASKRAVDVAHQQQSQSQSQGVRGRKAPSSQQQRQPPALSQSQSQSQLLSQIPDSQPTLPEDEEPVENFTTFFKVGGGMTANDYATIRHATDGKWHRWDSRRPAAADYLDQGDLSRLAERPDMWIKPSDSLVVEVKAAQVTTSEDFGFGHTLRFPRFVRLRRDRDWTTALSVDGFYDLKTKAQNVEEERQMQVDQKRKEKRKVRTGGYSSRKKPLTVAGYNARDVNAVQLADGPRGTVFEGLTFYILTESALPGDHKKTKLELEALVKSHGGKIVQTATPTTTSDDVDDSVICIALRRTVKVASLEKRGEKEIVKPIWLFDCIEQGQREFARGMAEETVVPFEPERHFFFVPADRQEAYTDNVDEYGDSFARDINEVELKDIMDKMGIVKIEKDDKEEEGDLANFFGDEILNMKAFLFHKMVFFFDQSLPSPSRNNDTPTSTPHPHDSSTFQAKSTARFAGAHVLPTQYITLSSVPANLKSTITHIIAHADSDVADLRRQVSKWEGRRIPRVMNHEWIRVCWEEGTRVDEGAYVAR